MAEKDRSKLMERSVKVVPSPLIKTGLSPRGERVLVFRDKVPEKTHGGIILPEKERGFQEAGTGTGRLLAAGADAWSDYGGPFAKVGDRVIFGQYAGKNVDDEESGEKLLILNDNDILGVLKDG